MSCNLSSSSLLWESFDKDFSTFSSSSLYVLKFKAIMEKVKGI